MTNSKKKPKKIRPKFIDQNYKWRNPTIIDRDPELIDFLKTNPRYEEALAYRKVMLWRREQFIAMERRRPLVPREELDIFSDDYRHLKIVK